jgi:hypothetical protein
MVSTRTKIYHQNHLSLLGKRQGGSEDFQGTKKLVVVFRVKVELKTGYFLKDLLFLF